MFSREYYETERMQRVRRDAVERAAASSGKFGLILGTLGRQGAPKVLEVYPCQLFCFPDARCRGGASLCVCVCLCLSVCLSVCLRS